jgi:hypothetical protein
VKNLNDLYGGKSLLLVVAKGKGEGNDSEEKTERTRHAVSRYLGPSILHENAFLNPLYLEQNHV